MPIRIEIYLDGAAPARTPKVRQLSGKTCLAHPGAACGQGGSRVDWTAAQGLFWMVVFEGDTPFLNRGQVLTGRTPGNNEDGGNLRADVASGTEFKYWVLCKEGGAVYVADPKLVISDDGEPVIPAEAVRAYAEDLVRFAEEAEALAARASRLAIVTADFMDLLEPSGGRADEGEADEPEAPAG